jgi:two-component system phosphate regulon sensor histidine kinase PhoR
VLLTIARLVLYGSRQPLSAWESQTLRRLRRLKTYSDALGRLREAIAVRRAVAKSSRARGLHRQEPVSTLAAIQSILRALPDAALMVDEFGVLVAANALAIDALGDVKPGRPLSATSRRPELQAIVARAFDSEERVAFELTTRPPIERRMLGSATRVEGLGGAAPSRHVLIVLQDNTERDALSRMRMEFVANASHELRTPLASLTGFIETMAGPAKDDAAARQRFLGIMAEQAARMTRLIDDLLILSRVEMRAHLAPTGTVDLNDVITDAARQLAEAAKKDNISLIVEPSPRPVQVTGDQDELMQAAYNLVHNAIKYGRPGGTVSLRTALDHDRAGGRARGRLIVADDGPGIAAEHIPRLTERFYRVNTADSRKKDGTGLGLAIVKHIVTRHRGTIDIASDVGRGATFTLGFPATSA